MSLLRLFSSKAPYLKEAIQQSYHWKHTGTKAFFSTSGGLLHGKPGVSRGDGPYTVHFVTPEGDTIDVKATEGDTMLDLAQRYDIDLECACEGSLACSTCHVICNEEYYDKMEEPTDEENDMLDLAFGLTDTSRLGCQIEMNEELDGITVRIPSATRNLRVDDTTRNKRRRYNMDPVAESTATDGPDIIPQSSTSSKKRQRRVIVVLENASLEAAHVSSKSPNKLQLLNCDEHQSILKRLGRDIADARPDIVHQCLLTLLDSPLNKSGHLEVYIHTSQGVLIRINPECRIPRTIKRFSGLMIQLLERQRITKQGGGARLLEIIHGPLASHLPANAIKLALSWNAPKVRLYKYFKELDLDERPLVIAVGAMAKGEDTFADAYTDQKIGISDFSLSASVACAKVCCSLEDLWDVM